MTEGRDVRGWRNEEMRAFLLGTLPAGRKASLEEHIFDEEDAYDALLDARYDLLDEYARGTLLPAEREQVERLLLGAVSDEALALADVLATRLPDTRARTVRPAGVRSQLRAHLPLLTAAALALVAVGTSVRLTVDNQRLRADLERARDVAPPAAAAAPGTPAAPVAPLIPRLVLSSRTTRSDAESPLLEAAAAASVIELVLPIDEMLQDYQVALEGRGGRLWFQRLATRAADGTLHVWLPGSLLTEGSYEVLVLGGQNDDASLVATYAFRIRRQGPS